MRGRWTRSSIVFSTSEDGPAVVDEDTAVPGARLFSIGAVGSVMLSLRYLGWEGVARYVDPDILDNLAKRFREMPKNQCGAGIFGKREKFRVRT
jgi:hypothetical protein